VKARLKLSRLDYCKSRHPLKIAEIPRNQRRILQQRAGRNDCVRSLDADQPAQLRCFLNNSVFDGNFRRFREQNTPVVDLACDERLKAQDFQPGNCGVAAPTALQRTHQSVPCRECFCHGIYPNIRIQQPAHFPIYEIRWSRLSHWPRIRRSYSSPSLGAVIRSRSCSSASRSTARRWDSTTVSRKRPEGGNLSGSSRIMRPFSIVASSVMAGIGMTLREPSAFGKSGFRAFSTCPEFPWPRHRQRSGEWLSGTAILSHRYVRFRQGYHRIARRSGKIEFSRRITGAASCAARLAGSRPVVDGRTTSRSPGSRGHRRIDYFAAATRRAGVCCVKNQPLVKAVKT
jgi:hypothetical protein